jgi:uncharacterized membrane protein (UPF0127 family)
MCSIIIINKSQPGSRVLKVKYCDTYFSRLIGLMFNNNIKPDEGLLFKNRSESKINSSIHMLFMRFSIAAIWLNKDCQVVDKKLCHPWRLIYAPIKPAQFTIETSIDGFNDFNIDDLLFMSKC